MRAAQENKVVEASRAAVGPVDDVVGVGKRRRAVTAGMDAAAVADGQGGAEGRRDDAGPTPDIERLAGPVDQDAGHRRVTGEPAR